MGGKGSKVSSTDSSANNVSPSTKDSLSTPNETDYSKYRAFRDELFSFSLGESAFEYAESLFKTHPESPEVMALLAETCALYDKNKNKVYRDHWCDRLDLLQRGVDVSRKCFTENPAYGPCYRTYVMCATRESESLYYLKSLSGIGLLENFKAIMAKGKKCMELAPEDAETPNALGALCARCAYKWYDPTRLYGKLYGVPSAKELMKESIALHTKAVENSPENLEYACRLAQAYFQSGDFPNARRWYIKVRDEMPPQDLKDEKWQSLAHTQLSTAFTTTKWNVPFG